MVPNFFILVEDSNGGAPYQMPAALNSLGQLVLTNVLTAGMRLTTAGVTDSVDKRFVTDVELAAINDYINEAPEESLQAFNVSVDMNEATKARQPLFTVPADVICIVTKVIIRDPSVSLDTASISFGYNAAGNDLIADGKHTTLTTATSFVLVHVNTGGIIGNAGDVLAMVVNTKQNAVATAIVDVSAYFVPITH
jgi:hypothetical protein